MIVLWFALFPVTVRWDRGYTHHNQWQL